MSEHLNAPRSAPHGWQSSRCTCNYYNEFLSELNLEIFFKKKLSNCRSWN